MTKKISQREAVRLKKKVRELESRFTSLRNGWEGVVIDTWSLSDSQYARIKTAGLLDHTILLRRSYSGTEVEIRAVKL